METNVTFSVIRYSHAFLFRFVYLFIFFAAVMEAGTCLSTLSSPHGDRFLHVLMRESDCCT